MKKLLIPIELFDFKKNKVSNIISGLKKIYNYGYEIIVDQKPTDFIFDVLRNEKIKIKIVSGGPNSEKYFHLYYDKKKMNISYNNKVYNSLNDFADKIIKTNRTIEYARKTAETEICLTINLDGNGKSKIKTGIGFFDHMLEQIVHHSNIDLSIEAKGDLWVDEHHTVEDIGITIGEAILKVLNDKKGIKRFGFAVPMDDSIALCSIDLSGRSFLNFNCKFQRERIGEFPTELVKEFFKGIAQGLKANIFIQAKGENEHHKIESIFKAFAKALNEACRLDERNKGKLPTTKGLL